MKNLDGSAARLLENYRDGVRSLLDEQKLPTLDGLDRSAVVLESMLKQKPRLSIGFLGEAQVGKSSLINALVGSTALPAGGIGPLTAQATRVTHAPDRYFEVRYHGGKELRYLAFSVEQHMRRQGLLQGAAAAVPTDGASEDVGEAGVEDIADEAAVEPGDQSTRRTSTKMAYMLKQAELLLTGHPGKFSQSEDLALPLQLQALRALTAEEPDLQGLSLEIQGRVTSIRTLIGQTERCVESRLGGRAKFEAELRLRAAGWMSPLVAELTVALNSDLVSDLDLVDLPGIGVVADPGGKVAEEFVTKQGDALVLVVRNSGLPSKLAELLEETGVITKLLFGGRDGVMPIHVLVAVTHLDDVARERYRDLAQAARSAGEAAPDRHALFQSLAGEMSDKIRAQLRASLRESDSFNDIAQEQASRREEVIEEIFRTVTVKCVAAPDFNLIGEGFVEDAFLKNPEATNVPAMRQALLDLAARAKAGRDRRIREAAAELRASVVDHLTSVRQSCEDGDGVAVRQWELLRSELEKKLGELRPTMAAYHGKALGFLQDVLPVVIENMCEVAQRSALAKLQRLLRHGEGLHWASLNAALSRGGVWDRREVNYPAGITRAFVDAIATDWGGRVVEAIRELVKALAEQDIGLVEELCSVARQHDARVVVEAQIEQQQRMLQQHARSCITWTGEKLEELRTAVHQSLSAVVSELIDAACKKARSAGKNRGQGAKRAILRVFEEAGSEAIAEASKASRALLRGHQKKLVKELDEGFLKEHHDPLEAAFQALANQELSRAKRSDAQKRRVIAGRVEKLLEALPALPAEA